MGILIALIIILSWISHCAYMLILLEWNPTSFGLWLHVALQTYLSVGLFITAHDAMHGTVSGNKRINNIIGWIACFLFAGMNYKRLITNHMAHHTYPGTEKDPDYDMSQIYVIWFLRFMIRYTTISQLIVMG
jgi:beta-carotene ketolase (CrtW type)